MRFLRHFLICFLAAAPLAAAAQDWPAKPVRTLITFPPGGPSEIPRAGRPPSPWMKTDFGETSVALGQFILLVAGIALLVKGMF